MTMFFIQLALSFATIFLKGLQTQTVIGSSIPLAGMVSVVCTVATVSSLLLLVDVGWSSLLPLCIGSALGIMCSMKFYRGITQEKPNE